MKNLLQIVNLEKRFEFHILNGKTIDALHRVSLEVCDGEILALTGKSGSGKSTIMKCVYRTYLASRGQILYRTAQGEIVDLATASEHAVLRVRKTEMTYCSQFLQVIPRVAAIDVVASALVPRGRSIEEARLAAGDCFERLSLPKELWESYPATFSGGEQQRVNIARAMIAQPRILLVDEPTASLDPKTKEAVIEMLRELRETGTSIILISHDEHTLARLSDRSLHLENGRLKDAAYA
jgi:alpha-D-ribose 1-methylphosphonate 5-triphosphate synthase subunit PhnL